MMIFHSYVNLPEVKFFKTRPESNPKKAMKTNSRRGTKKWHEVKASFSMRCTVSGMFTTSNESTEQPDVARLEQATGLMLYKTCPWGIRRYKRYKRPLAVTSWFQRLMSSHNFSISHLKTKFNTFFWGFPRIPFMPAAWRRAKALPPGSCSLNINGNPPKLSFEKKTPIIPCWEYLYKYIYICICICMCI